MFPFFLSSKPEAGETGLVKEDKKTITLASSSPTKKIVQVYKSKFTGVSHVIVMHKADSALKTDLIFAINSIRRL